MNTVDTCARLVESVRAKSPLVHHITNYVTVNDCANVTLAIGASPIMADAVEEVEDIVAIASSLVLNLGTLNPRGIEAMLAAGKCANARGIPVVLDPVGAGASRLRNAAIARILDSVRVAVIRGNISEIRHVGGLAASTKGVDAGSSDLDTDAGEIVTTLAAKMGCVVAVTGSVDAISNGRKTILVSNGNSSLSKITGTGCMCTSLVGSMCGAAPDEPFLAAVTGIMCMGIAGEIAFARAGSLGNGSFHEAILDAISLMDAAAIEEKARIDEIGN